MLHSIHAWLIAGTPPNYVYLAGLYALTTFVLLKIPKVRANTIVEAIFNAVNPYVMPLVSMIPILGPLLAKLLGTLDTPAPHEKMELPKGPALLLPLAFLPLLSGCDWRPIDPHTGLSVVLIAGALLMARALALRSTALALVLLPALLVSGCATTSPAYIAALKIESATATGVLDGYEGWRQVDLKHQRDIIASASTLDEGKRALSEWRAARDKIDEGFIAARKAMQAYAASLSATGAAQAGDWGAAIGDLVTAVSALASLLAQYGIKIPLPVGG